jgi:AraC-like DNA-binding protein
VNVWRPSRSTARQLRDLHSIAIRAAHARSSALTSARATHGLEQQVLDALLLGLSERPLTPDAAGQQKTELMARLEDLLNIQTASELGVAELSGALGVSAAWLRRCCEARLGMSLAEYLKVRRLQSAHHDLRRAGTAPMRVADIAKHYGFRDPGRFAGAYRDFFGELPSDTLRRPMTGPVTPLTRRKGRH